MLLEPASRVKVSMKKKRRGEREGRGVYKGVD